ncbi:unnamed protein product, partial [Meganyctiphanes norvegica]
MGRFHPTRNNSKTRLITTRISSILVQKLNIKMPISQVLLDQIASNLANLSRITVLQAINKLPPKSYFKGPLLFVLPAIKNIPPTSYFKGTQFSKNFSRYELKCSWPGKVRDAVSIFISSKFKSYDFLNNINKNNKKCDRTLCEIIVANEVEFCQRFTATLGAMAMGTVLGYSSPAGLQLTSNSTSQIHLDANENTWFASTMNLGALVGGPLTGILMNNIGRKGTMIVSIIPFLLGWGLICFAQNFEMLIGGRVATGLCCGMMSFVVPTYIGEFASPEIRGTLGSGFQLMVTIGLLYSLVVGSYTTWQYLAVATAIIPCVFVLLMFFSKESPSYLLSKNKEQEASKALQYFRGADYNIQTELDTMRETVREAQRSKAGFSDLGKPHIMRPLFISLALMFFQQFSGINAVLFNLGIIFESSGSSMSSEVSSIIIGVVQVVSTFVACLLMDKAGRKILLIASSSVMTISAAALGYYFYEKEFNEKYATEHLSWLPLLALILFISSFSLGYGPIPWLMMGELFSADVKELAGSIATAFNWTLSFIVTSIFVSLQHSISGVDTYYAFLSEYFLTVILIV